MRYATKSLAVFKNYGIIAITLLISWIFSKGTDSLLHSSLVHHGEHLETVGIIVDIVVVFALGFIAYETAKPTVIPSFVIAIFFGFVSKDLLELVTSNQAALSILTTIGATLILFGGGLEAPFTRFKQLIGPILSLAFLGTIITAILFSGVLDTINKGFNLSIPLAAIILLGTALASTDPAAIIPSFKSLLFHKPRVKYIAISESALNDVVGALITSVFLGLFLGSFQPDSILSAYSNLFSLDIFLEILKSVGIGAAAGYTGYLILKAWDKWKQKIDTEGEADAALFLAIPLFTFALASTFGGNGYLGVFVTGLIFQLRSHVKHVEHFFNHTIEGLKPLIFMLLGTLVNFESLAQYALPGLIIGILFILVLRPICIFLTLSPFVFFGKQKFSLQELLFLSFVRETGVIPAVLLVSIKVAGIPGSDAALAIGMWVILLTLILLPPFTPAVAKLLKIADDMPAFPVSKQTGPVAVLCSRSYTFLERIEQVVEWCEKHHIENIMLLHCPEERYSDKFLKEVEEVAAVRFNSINERQTTENKHPINFSFLGFPGKLEDNIEKLVKDNKISIVFVGSRMLDYRLEKVKMLKVPFIFMN